MTKITTRTIITRADYLYQNIALAFLVISGTGLYEDYTENDPDTYLLLPHLEVLPTPSGYAREFYFCQSHWRK